MTPDDQPTVFTKPPEPSRSSPPGVWVAPSVEELQARLPQYEVIEILGRGGMGAVYKARQKSLKRLVAIKVLPLGMADDEFKFAERFQNEAQTMAQMNHPAIVSVYDFGETSDGLLYFVMEFVDGTDVQKMIASSGRLSGEYALKITAHVCDALSYAHKRGVIHRDIKPANILIDSEGHIKVADFGLAKMHDPAQTSGLTKTNMAMGTPDYVAPEVLSPGMVADHRADLYAVGVMLYQMLTGEVPRGMFKLPSQKGIGSDERFDAIICKAMEQDREERYQSAMDVRRDLDVILTTPQPKNDGTGVMAEKDIPQKPVGMQPRPPGERSQPPSQKPAQAETASAPASAKAKAPPNKQSPATMWLSIGGIVAVLGVAGFLVLGGKPKPEASAASDSTVATTPSAKGKEIDLLSLVDVKRDAIWGEWTLTADGLSKRGAGTVKDGSPRLQLPYQPPAEYDFEMEFTATGGTGNIGQLVTDRGRAFGWMLNTAKEGEHSAGFGLLDGKGSSAKIESSAAMPAGIENGRRYRSRVEVRAGSLRGFLDDKLLVNWSGDINRLSRDEGSKLRNDACLGLRPDRDLIFHKLTVREITGAGKVDAAVALASAEPAGQTIDWLKSAKWDAPWSIANGRLKSTDKGETRYLGVAREATVRLRFRDDGSEAISKTSPPLQVSFYGHTKGGSQANEGTYQLQVFPARRRLLLLKINKDAVTQADVPTSIWKDITFPAAPPGEEDTELQLRAVGDEISVWSGADKLASAHDDRGRAGGWLVICSPGVEISRLETLGITPNPGTISSAQAMDSSPELPDGLKWQDVTPALRDYFKAKPGIVMEGELITWNGDKQNPAHFTVSPEGQNDYAIRLKHVGAGQINVRFNEKGFIYVQSAPSGLRINRWMKGVTAPVTLLAAKDIPFSYSKGDPHDLTITVQGSTIRAWLDGLFMGTAEDTMFAEGTGAVALVSSGKVQKVEIAEVKGEAASAKPVPPPTITAWHDMTNALREKVQSRTGFIVEPDAVRFDSANALNGKIGITEATARNRAVRVTYIGEAQISLWFKSAVGSFYVLARPRETIFKRVDASDATLPFQPTVPHPAGFDSTQPHELLLVVQDSVLRTWIDGRFVSEAKDDALMETGMSLVITKTSVVRKVEIADVSEGKAQSDASWTDWLTPKLAASAFGPPDWTVEKDGLTTDKPIYGRNLLADDTQDAAVRLTYDLRSSAGIQVTMRERKGTPNGREMYFADDTGDTLYISRMLPDGTIKGLSYQKYDTASTSRTVARTLEFRCVGDTLTATVTGATAAPIVVTATDATLPLGSVGMVLKKGVLLKKVEIAELDGAAAKGAWQPIFMKPEDFGGDLRDVEFRDGATFLKIRSKAAPAEPSIVAIRATVRFCASDRTGSLSLRSAEGAPYGEEDFACMAFVSPSVGMVMKVRDRTTGSPVLKRHDFRLSPALTLEESFTFELRAADGKITASINGHEVGSVPDTWKGGARRFSITPSATEMTEFRDVAVMRTK